MIRNENGECMIEHHTKYREIHGVDETVWMTRGEHMILHRRLRKEGKCNVPVKELAKISIAAIRRTDKSIEYSRKYGLTEKCRIKTNNYHKKNYHNFQFYDTMMPLVRHCEMIQVNKNTENFCVNCFFAATYYKKLLYIDID